MSFAEPAGRIEQRVNHAFPFFSGMTVATLAFALLGVRLTYLPRREWLLIAAGLAALAVLCSPMVRVTTGSFCADWLPPAPPGRGRAAEVVGGARAAGIQIWIIVPSS